MSRIDRLSTPEHKAAAAQGRRNAAARRQAAKTSAAAEVEKARGFAEEWTGRTIEQLSMADLAEANAVRLLVQLTNETILVTTPTQANQLLTTVHNILRLEKGQSTTNSGGGNRESILAEIQALLAKKKPATPE